MTTNIRRQLTLFVEQKDATAIEQIRQQFNPIQYELIKSHVTLCRENEIQRLNEIIQSLHVLKHPELVISFGAVSRSAEGKGVLLPALPDNFEFHALRKQILFGVYNSPDFHEPHITLLHPRNAICTDKIFEEIIKINLPAKLIFKRINLIEQKDGGRWNILQEFDLNQRTNNKDYKMAVQFTIEYKGNPVKVSGGQGTEYWELIFPNGKRELLDPGGNQWVFVDDELKDLPDAEMMHRNAEATLLGKLLIEKAEALKLDY